MKNELKTKQTKRLGSDCLFAKNQSVIYMLELINNSPIDNNPSGSSFFVMVHN